MNQTFETYFYTFVNYAQDDQYKTLLSAKVVINNKDVALTKVSLFFLQHSYYIKPLNLQLSLTKEVAQQSLIQQANAIVQKLKDACEQA